MISNRPNRNRRKSAQSKSITEKAESRRPQNHNKHAKPNLWFRNVQKQNRVNGKEYISRKGTTNIAKEPRYMESCNCRFKCSDHFDEENQKQLFHDFYNLQTTMAQKAFISPFIEETEVVRKRSRQNIAKRQKQKSRFYYMPLESKRIRVCLKFFLFVFQISHQYINDILKRRTPTGAIVNVQHGLTGQKPANATPEPSLRLVREHINSFPRIPSHYCRKDSRKLYLDPELNISILHRLYLSFCEERKETPVHFQIYSKVFHSYNPPLCFFVPKKDACDFCEMYKNTPKPCSLELHEKYEAHKRREKESIDMKKADMNELSERHRVITHDMQATLSIPASRESILYYKRKLSLYHFTIYDCLGNGLGFLFDETNETKGCNEVATSLLM